MEDLLNSVVPARSAVEQTPLTAPAAPVAVSEEVPQDEKLCPWVGWNEHGNPCILTSVLYQYLKSKECETPIVTVKCDNSDKLALYTYYDGYYHLLGKSRAEAIIKRYMPVGIRTSRDWQEIYKEFMTDEPDYQECELDADKNLINFKNGLLHLDNSELTPHDPTILSTVQIPCNYIPNLEWGTDSVFASFLNTLTDGNSEDQALILEFIGAVISNIPGYQFKKLLVLEGAGNTGKSKLREFIIELVGKENCQSIDLKQLNSRFGTSHAYGRRLVGSGDLSYASIAEMCRVKELTGGDDLFAERKGQNGFSFRYRGYLLFVTNELPTFSGDRGDHVFQRFEIVSCNHIIPQEEQDANLLEKLLAEKETVVSIAIEYLKRAIARGYRFTESECVQLNREKYKERNSSLITFVNNFCDLDTGLVTRAEFNRVYIRWCRENRLSIEAPRKIEPVLKQVFSIEAKKSTGIFYYPITLKIN